MDGIESGLVRIGVVSSVEGHRARVYFEDVDMVSGWLYVLQHSGGAVTVGQAQEHTHTARTGFWMPSVGQRVVCLYLPVFNGDGFVLGAVA